MCNCDDYDPPEFFNCDTVTARKPHRCCECGCQIARGEKYERATGKWEGNLETFKTCSACCELRYAITDGCWVYGHLVDDVSEIRGDLPRAAGVDEFITRFDSRRAVKA